MPPEFPHKERLSDVGELFRRTWEAYKRRFWTLISLYLLSIVFFAVPFGLFLGAGLLSAIFLPGGKVLAVTIGTIAGSLIGSIMLFWGLAALLYATADENIGVRDALGKGWENIGSFVWLFSITGFIVTGGFLLFIIPGVVFAIWFLFAQFILAGEDERGMKAFLISREYVRGHWWGVFGRMLLVGLVSGVLGIVPIIGPIFSILFVPFMMLFMFLLYRDLKEIKGEIAYLPSAGEKLKWIAIGVIGYVAIPLMIYAFSKSPYAPGLMAKLMEPSAGEFFSQMESQMEGRTTTPQEATPSYTPTELEGAWGGTEIGGASRYTMSIAGDTIDFTDSSGREWYRGRLTLAASGLPKKIDVLITDTPNDALRGKTALGIYKIEGAKATLCGSEPGYPERPFTFDPSLQAGSAGAFRCFEMDKESDTPVQKPLPARTEGGQTGGGPVEGSGGGAGFSQSEARPMVYIYSLNYKGMVKLNGEELYEIKGEKDMNYNYSGSGDFRRGKNVIDVEYESLPDPWSTELRIKVYKPDWQSGSEQVIGEWTMKDKEGQKSIEFVVD